MMYIFTGPTQEYMGHKTRTIFNPNLAPRGKAYLFVIHSFLQEILNTYSVPEIGMLNKPGS